MQLIKKQLNVFSDRSLYLKLNLKNGANKADFTETTEKKVVNAESYLTYIEKKKKMRIEKELLVEQEKKMPGHGNLWKNQKGLPLKQKFNAALIKISPKEGGIKSLRKVYLKIIIQPLNPDKFQLINNSDVKSQLSNFISINNNENFDKELVIL